MINALGDLCSSPTSRNTRFSLVTDLRRTIVSVPGGLSKLDCSSPLKMRINSLAGSDTITRSRNITSSVFNGLRTRFMADTDTVTCLVFVLLCAPYITTVKTCVHRFNHRCSCFVTN